MEETVPGEKTPHVNDIILHELAEMSGQPFQSVKDSFEMLKSFDEVAEACSKCGTTDVKIYVTKILAENFGT